MTPITVTGISGRSYRITFGTNAMCRLEDQFNATRAPEDALGCDEIMLLILTRPRVLIREIRLFVQSCLVDPPSPSLDETGAIIDDMGGPAVFVKALPMVNLGLVQAEPGQLAMDAVDAGPVN